MLWSRINKYAERSDQGHAVSASKGANGWVFTAWGPEAMPGAKYWDWHDTHAKEHCKRGEAVAQRSECLGYYRTADEARAACERHSAALAA
jgi:hypothetical protein